MLRNYGRNDRTELDLKGVCDGIVQHLFPLQNNTSSSDFEHDEDEDSKDEHSEDDDFEDEEIEGDDFEDDDYDDDGSDD